jgi:hypothetical protein
MLRHSSRLIRMGLFLSLLLLPFAAFGGSFPRAYAARSAQNVERHHAALADGSLIRDSANGRVYLIWAGVRHWITSEATLHELGFNDSNPVNHTDAFVATFPAGSDLSLHLVTNLVFPLAPIISGSASLRLPAPSGVAGSSFQIVGANFGHNESVQVTVAGTAQTVTTDGSGNFTAHATVPSSASPGTVLDITALGTTSHVFQVEPFNVIASAAPAAVASQTATAAQGATVLLNGTGFAPGEQVYLFLAQGGSSLTVVANSSGSFTGATVQVPASLSTGQHTLIAYGVSSKRLANNTVQIVKAVTGPAAIKLDRTTANPGSLVQISGQNFGSKETVNITLGSTVVLTATTAVSGTFGPIGFTIPTNAAPGNIAVTAAGQTSKQSATSSLTVVAFKPSLTVSPTSATPGTTETVSGQGYAAGEAVTLALNGQALTTTPSVITTTATGTFSATFTVPPTALSGANTLAATGTTSRASATASITVSLPLQSTWYFAGGSTNPGMTTQIALTNPNDQPAVVTFSFMFTSGSTMPYTTTVAANSRATVDVGSIVGQNRDVFTMLTADRKIGASETIFRNGQDFSSAIGASAPLRTWYLAEGYTGISFHEYIRIFNPGDTVAHADLRLLPFNGRPATSVTKTVNPRSGLIVDVNSIAPKQSLSAIVDSDQPVVVDRLMTFGVNSYGATEQVGSNTPSSTWLFAEGSTLNNFETFLTVLNPSSSQPAAVTATFFDHAGNVLGNDTIIIDPLRRGNIKVNDFVHSSGIATILTSNIPVLAERPLYFGAPNSTTAAAGGSDVFGRNGGGVTWLFPEGNTGSSFREFLLLQNPSAQAAPVTVRFYETNGKTVDYSVVLPAKSRATVDVLKDVPSLSPGTHSALVRSTSGVSIIAEQSIYSDNFTKGDGEAGIAQ